jgi:hypothetical protein
LWIDFAGHVEGLIGNDRPLDPVVGLANKAPEHAARLAACLAYFNGDCDTEGLVINAERMAAGITLVEYYLGEALRIRDAAAISADVSLAKKLLRWLHGGWPEPNRLVSLPDVYQLSPISAIREKATAVRIVTMLEEHGWLERCSPKKTTLVNGVPRRQAWRIVPARGQVTE